MQIIYVHMHGYIHIGHNTHKYMYTLYIVWQGYKQYTTWLLLFAGIRFA